jgi:peptidyl-tRNA hydrolase
MTLTDITIGVTVDYSAGSVRFWIDSPDTYMNDDGGMVANSAWGFKMYNTDGYVNTSGFSYANRNSNWCLVLLH